MSKNTLFIRFKRGLALYAITSMVFTASFGPLSVYAQEAPTDVCPNIDGEQTSVPDGFVTDGNGDCVEDTPPATDVCPNIEGDQASVPDGFIVDENGDCVEDASITPLTLTPEEQCVADGGTWNTETVSCDTPPTPTPEEECTAGGGTWNTETESCDPPAGGTTPTPEETCTSEGGTWNSETSDCYTLAEQQQDACEAEDGTWNGADCIPDACPNIEGAQTVLPDGYVMFNDQCVLEELVTVESKNETATDGTGGFASGGDDGEGSLIGSTIITNDATATTTVQNDLNFNRTNLHGPGNTNSSTLTNENTNYADVDTYSEADASTGENDAEGGTGKATVDSGNAFAAADVFNVVNSNLFNSDGNVFSFNQVKGRGIDLNQYDLNYFFEGGQGSSPVGPDEWIWNDEDGNGIVQSKEIKAGCTITTCLNSSTLQALNINEALVKNDVVVRADTGKNHAGALEAGGADIFTGNAYAGANVFNMVNTNFVNSSYLFVTFNNFGDMTDNVILPHADFFESLLSHGGYRPFLSMNSSTFDVTPTNDADFIGTTSADADTGGNIAASSGGEIGDDGEPNKTTGTGPEDAENGEPGGTDGPGGTIVTGNAYSSANVLNDVNSTLVGGASVFLFFRVWGDWSGQVVGLPDGVSWAATTYGGPADRRTDIVIWSDNQCDDGDRRCDPVDPEIIGLYNSSQFLATSTNKAVLENNVDVRAMTGENRVDTEQGAGYIETGDAYAAANVMNLVNTNVVSRNLVYATFNIVGDWSGDISFGIGTLNVDPPPVVDVCPNVPGDQETGPCADETCETDGGSWSGSSCVMPPPATDVCPNVPGTQTGGPCADTECTSSGGTWNGNSCDAAPTGGGGTGDTGGGSGSGGDTGGGGSSGGDSGGGGSSGGDSGGGSSGGSSEGSSGGSSGGGSSGGGGGGGGSVGAGFFGLPGMGANATNTPASGGGSSKLIPIRAKSATSTPDARINGGVDPVIIVEKNVRIGKVTATSTTVDYTVVVTNQKDAQPAYYTTLTDILYDPSGKVVYSRAWNLGNFERGDQVRLTYSVEFAATSTKPGIYKNLARVTGQRNQTTVKDQIIKMPTAEAWGEVEFGYVQTAAPAAPPPAACTALITTNLGLRLRNDPNEVLKLQIFLNSDPDTTIAASGPGSPGNETTVFGSLTAAAVRKFQQKYASEILHPLGLTSPTGSVYASTRAKINALACGTPALLNSVEQSTEDENISAVVNAPAPKPAPKPAAKKETPKTEAAPFGGLGNLFKGFGSLFSR